MSTEISALQNIPNHTRVLLTGATGYIGGRLLPELERLPIELRCLVRNPERLRNKISSSTEVCQGDLYDADSLQQCMEGVSVAYYLVHSMGEVRDFERKECQAAENFAKAAAAAGVKRIVYLGGLAQGDDNSPHMRSRHQVGVLLRASGVPVIEFRASIVIGSGSLSFEMIRALVERLPIMLTPRWVEVRAQPIAIENVLDYLLQALVIDVPGAGVVEIGGKGTVSYGELMRAYASQRGLKRLMIPVPVLTPYLSSLWLGLITPLYARIGRKLIESIIQPSVVLNPENAALFSVDVLDYTEAIKRALLNEDVHYAKTYWSDALSSSGLRESWAGVRFGNRIVHSITTTVDVSAEKAFKPIQRIGGAQGWYFADFLWHTRGAIDVLVGGVGLRRGRRDPELICVGDVLDFWRVESYQPGRSLRLRAEMKLPGRAWLQFEVEPFEGGAQLRQTAIYDPIGLWGLLYWYALYPVHSWMFRGMLKRIAAKA